MKKGDDCIKDKFLLQKSAVTDEEIELINTFTRRNFKSDEVYAFSVVLCDNKVDRDYERFTVDSLKTLAELFVGKTCIFDHDRKSSNQKARIFKTEIKTEEEITEYDGEPYTKLIARAYLPNTENNRELITSIDSGILKEVSISCAVSMSTCSICGQEECNHTKGESYNGKLCYRNLIEPTDAYECSFVAVPAQKNAGVVKNYKEGEKVDIINTIKSEKSNSFTGNNIRDLQKYLQDLEKKAEWGEHYKRKLCSNILKYSAIVQPDLSRGIMKTAISALSANELEEMERTFEKMASERLPIKPQLKASGEAGKSNSNGEFRI